MERVGQVADPKRIVLVTPAGGRTQRLEVYVDTGAEAQDLAQRFGGKCQEVKEDQWLPSPATSPGKPLVFGQHLLVTGHLSELAGLRAAHPDRARPLHPCRHGFWNG